MAGIPDTRAVDGNVGTDGIYKTRERPISSADSDEPVFNSQDFHLTEDNLQLNGRPPELEQCNPAHVQLLQNVASPDELLNMISIPEIPDLLSESQGGTFAAEKKKHLAQATYSAETTNFEDINRSNLVSFFPSGEAHDSCSESKKVTVLHKSKNHSALKSQTKIKQGRGRPKKQSSSAESSCLSCGASGTSSNAPSLNSESTAREKDFGKTNAEGNSTDNNVNSEDSECPRKKRGRPPSLCARTVPYGWKSKTREQRLADFKLLLSQCEDVEPERHSSSSVDLISPQSTSNPVTTQSQSGTSTSEPCTLSDNNIAEHDNIALSDSRDFQRPHVSPDSGISAGGSPAHIVASPHHAAPSTMVHEDAMTHDGPPMLEPMISCTGSSSKAFSGTRHHSLDHTVTSSSLCDSNSLYSKLHSSQRHSLGLSGLCDKRNLHKSVMSKNGRAKVCQIEREDTQSSEKNSHNIVNVADVSVKKKRGRPKSSGSSVKSTKDVNTAQSVSAPILSQRHHEQDLQTSPLQMPFVSPYINPCSYVMPQSSTSQMADYLDNIFERFHAEQSGMSKSNSNVELPLSPEQCPPKLVKQKHQSNEDGAISKKHRFSNNIKLSKNAKSAIKSKLTRALKLSGFSRDISFKRKRGRPRIHPLPVEQMKRGRGRPRKHPVSSPSSDCVPQITPSSKKSASSKASKSKMKSTQHVPNTSTSHNVPDLPFTHHITKVSFKSQGNGKDTEEFNIGPPVLFSEESLSPEVLLKEKPGDEFDKLMHSLQPVHARISAKFHRRLSEMDRTEDTISSDSENELGTSQAHGELTKDKKLVPNIRKAKLQVTPPKKRGRKKKLVSEPAQIYIDPEYQTEFSLPPSAYAFHKMSMSAMSDDIPTERHHNNSYHTTINSLNSFRCNSPETKLIEAENLKGFPKSPPSHQNISPGSQAGSTISALSRQSEEFHDIRRKSKKKKSKSFKSKHKNIVDPVFVAEVENLATDIENIKLSDVQHFTHLNRTNSPMSVPVVFHFGKRTSKALLKATSRQQKSFKSNTALSRLKKARKRRQIQDGLDMARKKHFLLKKKVRVGVDTEADVDTATRRPRGRPRKKPRDEDAVTSIETDLVSADESESENEAVPDAEDSDNEINSDKPEQITHSVRIKQQQQRQSAVDKAPPIESAKNISETNSDAKESSVGVKRRPGRPRKKSVSGCGSKDISQSKKSVSDENLASSVPINSADRQVCRSSKECEHSSQGTSTSNTSTNIFVQADCEVQCDLEPEEPEESPKPIKTTVDVGIQVDPKELKRLAAEQKQEFEKAEVGIQVHNEDSNGSAKNEVPVSRPLEIQVNFDEISDNEDDRVNLSSKVSEREKATALSSPRRSSPRRLTMLETEKDSNYVKSVDNSQDVNSTQQSDSLNDSKSLADETSTQTSENSNLSLCVQSNKEEKIIKNSRKKKGKTSQKSKKMKSCSARKPESVSLSNNLAQSPKELANDSLNTKNNRSSKVLSPKACKNQIDRDNQDKHIDTNQTDSCPDNSTTQSTKKPKDSDIVEKEPQQNDTDEVLKNGQSVRNEETVSTNHGTFENIKDTTLEPDNNIIPDSQEKILATPKSRSKKRSKHVESAIEATSLDIVRETLVESVTAAAKTGVISEISYEDFCKENEKDDTQGKIRSHSKGNKKRNRNTSGGKNNQHAECKKPAEVTKDPKDSEQTEKKKASVASEDHENNKNTEKKKSRKVSKYPQIDEFLEKKSSPVSKLSKSNKQKREKKLSEELNDPKSNQHAENRKPAEDLNDQKGNKQSQNSKPSNVSQDAISKEYFEKKKPSSVSKDSKGMGNLENNKPLSASKDPRPQVHSNKPQFQAAFESFLSSTAAPASQQESDNKDEEDKMESFFDGNEEVPFPAPETVDLTEGTEVTFNGENAVPNPSQKNDKANCDDAINAVKSKSMTPTKSPKRKKNHNSINKVQKDEIAKDIEIIDEFKQTDSTNTQVMTEESEFIGTETSGGGTNEKKSADVIIISETDDEGDQRGCPDCAKIQRACRGGSRRCRHRSGNVNKELNKDRRNPDNLSPVSSNSHRSHSGADSDRECVVILERLHASQLPKPAQDAQDIGDNVEGSNQNGEQTEESESPLDTATDGDKNSKEESDDKQSGDHRVILSSAEGDVDDVTFISCDNEHNVDNLVNEVFNSKGTPEVEETRSKGTPEPECHTHKKKKKKVSGRCRTKKGFKLKKKIPVATSGNENDSKCSVMNTETSVNEGVQETAVVHNIDDSDDDLQLSSCSHHRDTSPVICTIKRKNTNSEYEPLPVMKKKRKMQNDMGYSQPKRRRRKKSSVSSQIQSASSSVLAPLSIEIETIDLSMYDSSQDESASQTESESVVNSRPGTPARKSMEGPQLPRKRYQKSGLFSSCYKGDDCGKKKKTDPKMAVYDPAELEFGLMPAPIHVGKYMREKRIDFTLPYDIWWMHDNNLLKPMKMLSPKYKKIRNNVYVDCRPVCKYETHACNCRKPTSPSEGGCGENCLNRMIYTECNPSTCPCKDLCSNQRFQKHEEQTGLEKFVTQDRGQGVHCNTDVSTGTFMIEYVGEVITEAEFQDRMSEEYANDRHHYCLNLDSGLVIDGYRMGNLSRFVNHSCDPNCEMQKWNVNGVYRMGLFANQEIASGTELNYDYNFHSYNLDAQQECRCGSEKCRGVLGGKAGKFNGLLKEKWSQSTGKDKEKSKPKHKKKEKDKEPSNSSRSPSKESSPVKPLSHRERCMVQKRAIFLLRNLSKVKQVRQKSTPATPMEDQANPFIGRTDPTPEQDCFHTHLMALNTARTVKTRGLSVAQDNEEVSRVAKLAQIFQIIFVSVQTFKGDKGEVLSVPLQQCPSRKKHPEYYQMIEDPIDLNTIETRVTTGQYKSLEGFEGDFFKLFKNVEKYCGKKSEIGHAVSRLKKVFYTAKTECLPGLEELLGESSQTSAPSECSSLDTNDDKLEEEEEEEIIRCVCNIYRDEGVMIQCEKCEKWQHADCMGEPDVEKYMCELCEPRPLSKEVLMKPPPDDAKPECTYYLTLLRDKLQVRVGDAVYIVKDTNLVKADGVKIKLDYDDLARNVTQLDIFRVETLWKNESGEKFAFGHHYLRPHETFHEPNRKFFENEVFRIPLYEIVPLEAIVTNSVVMDLPTYCKGRPKHVKEKDVYICEYRIDKNARMFNKIGKPKYPINMKSYCFDRFPVKDYPKRTYSPHEVPDQYKKKTYTRSDSDQVSESGRSIHTVGSEPGNESDEDIPLAQLKHTKMKKKTKHLHSVCDKLYHTVVLKKEDSRTKTEHGKATEVTLQTLFPS